MPINAVLVVLLLADPQLSAVLPPDTGHGNVAASIFPNVPPQAAGIEVAQMARMVRIERQRKVACEKIRKRLKEALGRKNSAKRSNRLADLQRQSEERHCDF